MRQLFPENNNNIENIIADSSGFVTNVEFTRLVAKFDELLESFAALQDNFISLKTELGESVTTNNITANTGNISNIIAEIINTKNIIIEDKITASQISGLVSLITENIQAVNGQFNDINTSNISTDTLQAISANIDKITADTADIQNWTIENFEAENANIDNITNQTINSQTVTTSNLESAAMNIQTADISKITNRTLQTEQVDSFEVKSSQIVWKESQDLIDNDRFYIELPHFENGQYYIKAVADDNTTMFSVEVFNSVDNFLLRWSQDQVGYLERAFITVKENQIVFRVHNIDGKKLKLLFANISSTNVGAPNTYEEYDKEVRSIYIIEYKDGNKFFKPVDLFNDGVTVGVLTLDKTDNYNIVDDDVVSYDTTSNEHYTAYKPDQSVNTLDNVKFNSVEAPILNIYKAKIENKLQTPNIYNGPKPYDESLLNDDTLYIPNESETKYTGWAFSIKNISEYTDSWQDACKGYDWTRTKYKGEDLEFSQAKDITQITDYDIYHVASFENKYYLVYANSATNLGNACFLSIDNDTGAISYTNKLNAADKPFWDTALANDQITADKLQDYETVYLGDNFGTYGLKLIYKNIELYKATEIPYLVSVNQKGIIYRKTSETTVDGGQSVTETVIAEIIPINNESKQDYREGTPLTYNPDTREITNDEDINITGNLTVDSDAEFNSSVHIANELYVEGETNLSTVNADTANIKDLNVTNDAKISGDLYVTGTTHTTNTEDLVASGDILTLRANNEVGLADGQVSGIVVNNYNGTNDLALVTDNEGTLRVGTGDGAKTDYTNVLYDDKTKKWYEYTLDNDEVVLGNEITINGTVTSWINRRVENDYTIYDSITVTEIDKTTLVPLLGRDESENMTDQSLMKWNGDKLIAETIDKPNYSDLVLVSNVTEDDDGNKKVDYKWQRTLSSEQGMFDLCHPIGEVYTQYPWQKSPMELYNKLDEEGQTIIESFWNVLKDYDGAFFRAEGGLADPYQEEKQTSDKVIFSLIEDPRVFFTTTSVSYANLEAETYWSKNFYKIVKFERPNESNDNKWVLHYADGHEVSYTGTETIYNYNVALGQIQQLFADPDTLPYERFYKTLYKVSPSEEQVFARDSTSTTNTAVTLDYVLKHEDEHGYNSWNLYQNGVPANYQASMTNNPIYVNGIWAGDAEHLFNKWHAEVDENGNTYYSLESGQVNPITGLETVLSIASNANPTAAQHIIQFYRAPNSTQITCIFEDGHQTAYVDTTTVYDRNYSLGQIRGLELNFEKSTKNIDTYVCPQNDVIQYQLTSTATPTDAQIIDEFYRCDNVNDTTYDCLNVKYKDGSRSLVTSWSTNFYNKTELIGNQATILSSKAIYGQGRYVKTYQGYRPKSDDTWIIAGSIAYFVTKPTPNEPLENIPTSYKNDNFAMTEDNSYINVNTSNTNKLLIKMTSESSSIAYCPIDLMQYKWTKYNDNIYIPTYSLPASIFTGVATDTNDVYQAEYMSDTNEVKYFYTDENGDEQNIIYPIDTLFDITYTDVNGVEQTSQFSGYWVLLDYDEVEITRTEYCPPLRVQDGLNLYGDVVNLPYYSGPNNITVSILRVGTGAQSTANTIARLWFDDVNGVRKVFVQLENGTISQYNYNQEFYYWLENANWYIRSYVFDDNLPEIGQIPVTTYISPVINNRQTILKTTSSWNDSDRYTVDNVYVENSPSPYFNYTVHSFNTTGAEGNICSTSQPTFYLYYEDDHTLASTITWNSVITNSQSELGDVEYYYPPEKCYDGTDYICSVSNTLTPTDAQIVAKVDPIEGSNNYNVEFKDGHTVVYANTTSFYAICNNYNGLGANITYRITPHGMMQSYFYNFEEEQYTAYKAKDGYKLSITNTATPTEAQTIEWIAHGPMLNIAFNRYANGQKNVYYNNNTLYITDGTTTTAYTTASMLQQQYPQIGAEQIPVWQEGSAPNLVGTTSVSSRGVNSMSWDIYDKGVFKSVSGLYGAYWSMGHESATNSQSLRFDASLAQKTYGRRNEIAPNNYTMRLWVRVEEDEYIS